MAKPSTFEKGFVTPLGDGVFDAILLGGVISSAVLSSLLQKNIPDGDNSEIKEEKGEDRKQISCILAFSLSFFDLKSILFFETSVSLSWC